MKHLNSSGGPSSISEAGLEPEDALNQAAVLENPLSLPRQKQCFKLQGLTLEPLAGENFTDGFGDFPTIQQTLFLRANPSPTASPDMLLWVRLIAWQGVFRHRLASRQSACGGKLPV